MAAPEQPVSQEHVLPLGQAVTQPDAAAADRTAEMEDPCRIQFTAGTLLAQRYRILAKLGSGGLGTVYRAEDVTLQQDVALKFMAERCVHSEESVQLLLNEVRLARRVTHPAVCRVHDLGEIDGMPFISMEYVDGEDLSTLLRRIGHLPPAKAVQLARQLCAGLQAAHEQGVLHRDLKPANVMIDGRGNARIADFGIATARDDAAASERPSGTPSYMAPELFTGAKPTVQSDLYSLGLLLHELFTGQRVFNASTMTELLRQHRMPVVPPSRLVDGMDARTERAILSCLERDPQRRPRSALEVLYALPGGDPLAESLAAGQTPSPELVAAAGGTGAVSIRTALLLSGAVLVALVSFLWLEPHVKLISRAALPRSGEVLADRAAEQIAGFGLHRVGADRVWGFDVSTQYLAEIAARPDATDELWEERLSCRRPAVIDFWYRESPEPLVANNIKGRVTWNDPPPIVPGTVQVRLDPDGHLRELLAVPDPGLPPPSSSLSELPASTQMDWSGLFAVANLDPAKFSPVPPERIPPVYADRRAAWLGAYPDGARLPVRIEAAAFGGRPVAFHIDEARWPDRKPTALDQSRSAPVTWKFLARVVLILCALGLCVDSLRRRRGDVRGAFVLGLFMFGLVMGFTVLTGEHGTWSAVGALILKGMSHGLVVAVEFSLYYCALEPHVRRTWPESLIPWTRLLGGRIRDPLVGSTLLVGMVLGVASALISTSDVLLPRMLGQPEPPPHMLHRSAIEALMGPSHAVGALLELIVDATREGMKVFLSLVLLKLILKRPIPVALASGLIWASVWNQGASMSPTAWTVSWLATFAFAIAFTLVAIRFGLLAVIVGSIAFAVLMSFPVPTNLSVWYGQGTVIALGLILAGTAFGLTTATRPANGLVT